MIYLKINIKPVAKTVTVRSNVRNSVFCVILMSGLYQVVLEGVTKQFASEYTVDDSTWNCRDFFVLNGYSSIV